MRRFIRTSLSPSSSRSAKVGFIGMSTLFYPLTIRVSLRGYTPIGFNEENNLYLKSLAKVGLQNETNLSKFMQRSKIIFVNIEKDVLQCFLQKENGISHLLDENHTLIEVVGAKENIPNSKEEKCKQQETEKFNEENEELLNLCKKNGAKYLKLALDGNYDDARAGRIKIKVKGDFSSDKVLSRVLASLTKRGVEQEKQNENVLGA